MRAFAAALVLTVVFAGCNGKRPSASAPTGPPRPGGVLRVAATDITSLDPMLATSPSELEVATMLFTPLTTWDPATLAAQPGLASSWSATPDQKTWTFTLRAGAVFSDGHPVTARDVAFTYARVVSKGSGSPMAPLLFDFVRVTPMGSTVQIRLSTALAILPDILGNPALGIVEEAAPPTGATPIGSGPFAVSGRASGNMTLTRSQGSGALLDGIELAMFQDDAAAYSAFRARAIDWSPVPPLEAARAASVYRQPVSRPLDAELFYGFNLRDPVVADVRFRQAVVHAVNRAGIAAGAYRGTATPLMGVVPASTACGSACSYDPAQARAALANLFGPAGPPALTIDYDQGATGDAVVAALDRDLRAVGVFTNRRAAPAEAYIPNPSAGGDELLREGWIAKYPGYDGVLAPLFLSGNPDNLTGFASPQIDAAIRAARAEPDPDRRAAAYRDVEARIMAQAPVVPLVQFETHTVSGPNVGGLVVNGMGLWDPTTVWLARPR